MLWWGLKYITRQIDNGALDKSVTKLCIFIEYQNKIIYLDTVYVHNEWWWGLFFQTLVMIMEKRITWKWEKISHASLLLFGFFWQKFFLDKKESITPLRPLFGVNMSLSNGFTYLLQQEGDWFSNQNYDEVLFFLFY